MEKAIDNHKNIETRKNFRNPMKKMIRNLNEHHMIQMKIIIQISFVYHQSKKRLSKEKMKINNMIYNRIKY